MLPPEAASASGGPAPSHSSITSGSCSGLVKIYWSASGEVHARKGIDASFPSGAITAVVGPDLFGSHQEPAAVLESMVRLGVEVTVIAPARPPGYNLGPANDLVRDRTAHVVAWAVRATE